jgi:hypothetical protein
MKNEDALLERLDTLTALLRLAFAEPLRAAQEELRSDKVAAAVLDSARAEWIGAGELKERVAKSAKVSERTVQRTIAGLLERGLLRSEGATQSTRYRSSGVL